MSNVIAGGCNLDWLSRLTFKTSAGKIYEMIEGESTQDCCGKCCLESIDGDGCRLDDEEFDDLHCWGGGRKGVVLFYFKVVAND